MQRAATAERHGDEFRRVMSAFDRDQPDRAGHARLGDANDRCGRVHHIKPERLADVDGDRALGGLHVERFQFAADRAGRH